jgi:hypothetical protein
MTTDLHNKGTYNNLTEVWLKVPNGGNSEKDYVMINDTKCYWSFAENNWVTDGVTGTVVDNTQVVENDVDIKKNLTVEGSTKLKSLSLNDEDILNMFLRKDEQDSASETISFVKGINFSNGSSILKDDDGKWHLIVDDETINGKKITDILRTSDSGDPSDVNILSALKAIGTFLRKDVESTATKKITFLEGIEFTSGSSIYYSDGSWHLTIGSIEADKLTVDELDSKTTTNINGKSISDIIRTTDSTSVSDTNVFSALKASSMFLRKDVSDTASETMYFEKNTHVAGTAYAYDLNVTDKATINEVDATELQATNGTFSNLMKAAAATIVGLATIGTVSATTINVDSLAATKGTIETLGATAINADTINATGTTTSLNLVVQSLAKTYNMEVDNVATIVQVILNDYISSSTFTTGFSGSGFKLWKNSDSWNLELDTLTVRKVMNVFELLINKIRSVNGGLIVSPGNGKIKSVSLADSVYTLEIEGDMTFAAGDLVRCQTFRTTGSKYYWVPITTVSGSNITVAASSFTSSLPEVGDELVQFGNTTDTDRQGALYLVASEDGKPRIEVLNGISSTDLTGKVKAVFGDLDGITDTDFSSISGYGLYSQNVYLKGTFMLHSGVTVETAVANAQSAAATDATTKANDALSSAKSYVDSNYVSSSTYNSEITVLTNSISLKVSQTDFDSLNTVVSNHTSTLSQLSDTIDARITTQISSGGSIYKAVASSFTLSENGISLFGKTIDISGAVVFNSLATQSQAQSYASSALSSAKSYADTAQSNAVSTAASDATSKANSALSSAKSYTDTLKSSLGSLAYQSSVSAAMLESTIISGGYIKTSLLDTVSIVTSGLSAQTINANNATLQNLNVNVGTFTSCTIASATISGSLTCTNATFNNGTFNSITINTATINNATVTGTVTATAGAIGNFSISNGTLTSYSITTSYMTLSKKEIDISGYHLNESSGIYEYSNSIYIGDLDANTPMISGTYAIGTIRSVVSRTCTGSNYGNIGAYFDITGATSYNENGDVSSAYSGNNALYIPRGRITGFRLRGRRVTGQQTLSVMDSVILCEGNGSDYSLYLPTSNVEDFQPFFIRKCGSANIWIQGTIQDGWKGTQSSVEIQNSQMHIFTYDATNARWEHNYMS